MVHAFAQQRFNEIEGDFEEDMYKIRGMESDQGKDLTINFHCYLTFDLDT